MRKLTTVLTIIAVAAMGSVASAAINYYENFDSGTSAFNEFGGSLSHENSGGENYAQLQMTNDTRGGAYTYGPGKTILPQNFGTLTYSVDIFVDPTSMTQGNDSVWKMEVNLRHSGGNSEVFYGEFDFFGKWVQDDGEGNDDFIDLDGDGDTSDWIYKLGRNNDWRTAPVLVEDAGWYTFTSEWIDDGQSVTNHNYISKDGNVLFQGDSVQSPWASSPDGYETGYMWIYGESDTTATLNLDNLSYQCAVPEPATIAILGIGAVGLIRRKKNA